MTNTELESYVDVARMRERRSDTEGKWWIEREREKEYWMKVNEWCDLRDGRNINSSDEWSVEKKIH